MDLETPDESILVSPLRALYGSPIDVFRQTLHDQIIGTLTSNAGFSIEETQRDA
jgi:hypothetical protein